MNAESRIMCKCDICGTSFHFGHHRYDGHKNKTYDVMVCRSCRKNSLDGWAPHDEEKVTKKLIKRRLPLPERDKRGLLPYE